MLSAPRSAAAIVLALLLSFAVAGCGVKGSLQPPAGVENQSAPPDQSAPGKKRAKPHRDFILDGLLF